MAARDVPQPPRAEPTDEDARGGRPLLRVRDVARYLGLSENTIHHMCRKRRIPYLKISGRIRFEPDEFYRWVSEHRRGCARHG